MSKTIIHLLDTKEKIDAFAADSEVNNRLIIGGPACGKSLLKNEVHKRANVSDRLVIGIWGSYRAMERYSKEDIHWLADHYSINRPFRLGGQTRPNIKYCRMLVDSSTTKITAFVHARQFSLVAKWVPDFDIYYLPIMAYYVILYGEVFCDPNIKNRRDGIIELIDYDREAISEFESQIKRELKIAA